MPLKSINQSINQFQYYWNVSEITGYYDEEQLAGTGVAAK